MINRKVSLWLFLLLALAAVVLTVLFGAAVRHQLIGGQKLGPLGLWVEQVAAFPGLVRRVIVSVFSPKLDFVNQEQRFVGATNGATPNWANSQVPLHFLLINRYNADEGRSVSELFDMAEQRVIHTWRFSGLAKVWGGLNLESRFEPSIDASDRRFLTVHALPTAEGKLLTHAGIAPLVSADLCGRVHLVNQSAIYHHSLEWGVDNSVWMPKHNEPKTVPLGNSAFFDDGLAQISEGGQVLFEKSVVQLLDDNGLGHLIYGKGQANNDPIHLNDIEPVLADGKYWKKGDVFLSLRHQSMIVLYRPSTNKVLWYKQAPWIHQHDVNIVDDHRISVFNNNARVQGVANWVVNKSNEILVYNFENDTVTSPWKAGFEALDIRTPTQGRGLILGDAVLVEETDHGRLVLFDPTGKVLWQFINRAKDGKVYRLNWSRAVPKHVGDSIKQKVAETKCVQD